MIGLVAIFLILYLIAKYRKKIDEKRKDSLSVKNVQPIEIEKQNVKEYKIAGVTYKNEENKDIQKEIKKILKEYVDTDIISKDDMFLGYTNSEIKDMDLSVSQYEDISFSCKLKEDVFEDKPCIKVYIQRADLTTYTHIGYIPKRYNQIQELLDILHNYEDITLDLYIVGGKIKECKVETDDEYNEKFYVETTSLDYGLRLFVKYK